MREYQTADVTIRVSYPAQTDDSNRERKIKLEKWLKSALYENNEVDLRGGVFPTDAVLRYTESREEYAERKMAEIEARYEQAAERRAERALEERGHGGIW